MEKNEKEKVEKVILSLEKNDMIIMYNDRRVITVPDAARLVGMSYMAFYHYVGNLDPVDINGKLYVTYDRVLLIDRFRKAKKEMQENNIKFANERRGGRRKRTDGDEPAGV